MSSDIAPTGDCEAWDGRGTFQITGGIGAPAGLGIASAFRRERELDPELKKVTIPGPAEITAMLEPRAIAHSVWPDVVQLIRAETQELSRAGARNIQLDVPQMAMGLADADLANS